MPGAPPIQANTSGGSGGSTTNTQNFTTHVTAGNLLVIYVFNATDATTVINSIAWVGGNSGTLTPTPLSPITAGGKRMWCYTAQITASTGTGVTVTFSASINSVVIFAEYTGLATSSVIDQEISATGTGTAISSGNLTTTNANDTLVGGIFVTTSGGGTLTPGASFTLEVNNASTSHRGLEDRNVNATGSYAATATYSSAQTWIAHLLALKQAASGSGINFDFTSGVLPGAITFTRASIGTYNSSGGVLTTASANAARFNYVGGISNLLIEPAATNLLLQSNNFSTSWFPINGGVATAAQFVSPDGTSDGWSLTSGSGFGGIGLTATFSNVPYTISVWAKRITGTAPILLKINSAGSGDIVTAAAIARLAATITPNAATDGAYIVVDAATGSTNGIFGAQVETGLVATSYIPTTTATVTRSADSATFTIPAGVTQLTFTFDDNSTQVVSVVAGSYTIPTNLNRANIKSIVGVLTTVATPTVDNPAGTYTNSVAVTVSSTTPGATFCYRTDGTDPAATTPGTCDAGSTTYAAPIVLTGNATLKVLGTKSATINSSVLTQAYVINPGRAPATWYVSSSGSDSNTGVDSSHPWAHAPGMNGATGVAASTTLLPGDLVLLKCGDAWLNTTLTVPAGGISGSPITLSAFGTGAKPIISAAANNPAITAIAANMGFWTIDGLDLRASGIVSGINTPSTIYHNYWSSDMLPVPNWVIQNCVANASFYLSGPNTIVRNNVLDGTANSNPPFGGIVLRSAVNTNGLVEWNTVSHFTDRGVWVLRAANNPVVRYNIIHDILSGGDNEGTGINLDGFEIPVTGGQVYNNHLYACAGRGIDFENSTGSIAKYNLIHDCASYGFGVTTYSGFFGQASNIELTYNVIYNVLIGIVIWDTMTMKMIGNTIYNGVGAQSQGFAIQSLDTNVSQLTFQNNIIAGPFTNPIRVQTSKAIWTAFDYNDIVPDPSNLVLFQYSAGVNQTLAQLQALGLMTHGITGDPKFKSTVTPDLSLATGSPAIGTGVNLGASYQTALQPGSTWPAGVLTGPQAAAWNMGAYASATSGVVTVPRYQALVLTAGVPQQIPGTGAPGGVYWLAILNTGPGNLYLSTGATPGANATSMLIPAGKYAPSPISTAAPVWLASDQNGGVSIMTMPRGS